MVTLRKPTFPTTSYHFSRRHALGLGALTLAGSSLAMRKGRSDEVSRPRITVMAPLPPDPSPPGVIDYPMSGIEIWEGNEGADIHYDATAVENMKAKILINIRQGYYVHDVMYCAGWAQEVVQRLLPIDSILGSSLRSDLPPWSLNSFRWKGKTYGVPSVANPMILFYNRSLLDKAGISQPPSNWDELLETAKATTSSVSAGWVMPAGQTGGIGGLMSSWLLFFLQAGGDLFDNSGNSNIASDAGVVALDMLIKLVPYSDSAIFDYGSIGDASVAFMQGKSAMMANWAIMQRTMADPKLAPVADYIAAAPLPSGPIGTASIDSGDGWTIDNRTWLSGRSIQLIQYYLQPRIQIQLFEQTGWLPISRTALADQFVQSRAPHAAAVQIQMKSRIESGFRPNYDVMTKIIGDEILSALHGDVTPIIALRTARDNLASAARDGQPFS
jgi:multiple sugar transport system substrate-binding protein